MASFHQAQSDYDNQLPEDWHEDLELEERRQAYLEDRQEQQMLYRQFDEQTTKTETTSSQDASK